MGPVKAGEEAGVSKPTALAWNKHEAMIARMRELRGNAVTFVGASKQALFNNILEVAKEARAESHYKTALQAYELAYKIRCTDKDLEGHDASVLSGDVNDKDLLAQGIALLSAPRAMSLSECIDTTSEEQEA